MTPILGGDYSVARPSVLALKGRGLDFVARYLRDLDKTNGDKSLSLAEATALQGVGLTIVSNEETHGKQFLSGITGGRADAGAANIAHLAVGGPPTRPIFFSPWDHDPALLTAEQWRTGEQYMRGVISVLTLSRVGLYGGVELLDWAFEKGLCTYGWQAAGWAHGRMHPRANIIQTVGEVLPGVDPDHAVTLDYGQWDFKIGDEKLQLDAQDQAFITGAIHGQLQHALMLTLSGRTGSVFNKNDLANFHFDLFRSNANLGMSLDDLSARLANLPQMVIAALPANAGTFTLAEIQGACEQAVRNVSADAATP
jgi:hypothetical protein